MRETQRETTVEHRRPHSREAGVHFLASHPCLSCITTGRRRRRRRRRGKDVSSSGKVEETRRCSSSSSGGGGGHLSTDQCSIRVCIRCDAFAREITRSSADHEFTSSRNGKRLHQPTYPVARERKREKSESHNSSSSLLSLASLTHTVRLVSILPSGLIGCLSDLELSFSCFCCFRSSLSFPPS